MGTVSRYRVSAKIQQLLNTLKKPKRRPLNEFYEDDELVNNFKHIANLFWIFLRHSMCFGRSWNWPLALGTRTPRRRRGEP